MAGRGRRHKSPSGSEGTVRVVTHLQRTARTKERGAPRPSMYRRFGPKQNHPSHGGVSGGSLFPIRVAAAELWSGDAGYSDERLCRRGGGGRVD